jgi:hypothetical protein
MHGRLAVPWRAVHAWQGPALNTTAETGAEGNWAAEVSQPGVYTVTLIDTGIPLVAPGNVNPVAVNVPANGSAGC